MAGFRIEIQGDTNGNVGAQTYFYQDEKQTNDTETAKIISVVNKINRFTQDLKVIISPAE